VITNPHEEKSLSKEEKKGNDGCFTDQHLSELIGGFELNGCKNYFGDIADKLMNKSLIVTRNAGTETFFRVCEIEFYLNTKDHQDTFTHGDPI